MEDKGTHPVQLWSLPGDNMEKQVAMNKMERVFGAYEDKDKIKYIVLSLKLWNLLGRPFKVFDKEVIIEKNLHKYAYFFTDTEKYNMPIQVHALDSRVVRTVALKVTRVISPLYDTTQYQTEIAGRTTMNELAFILANVIREMDEHNYCKKEEMLKIIDKYLKD